MNSTKLIQYGNGAQTVFNTPNAAGFGATVSSSLVSYVPVITSQTTSAITLATAPPVNCKLSIRYFIGTQFLEDDNPTWSLDTSGNVVGQVFPNGIIFQSSGPITSIVYTNGQITSYVEAGVTYTLVYDGQGRVSTVTGGGLTRTVVYNGDGTVASFA